MDRSLLDISASAERLEVQRALIQSEEAIWYDPATDVQRDGGAAGAGGTSPGEATSDRQLSPTQQQAITNYFSREQ